MKELDSNAIVTIHILEATAEALKEFGLDYGCRIIKLGKEHVEALWGGKMLAWTDGEYNTFVVMEKT